MKRYFGSRWMSLVMVCIALGVNSVQGSGPKMLVYADNDEDTIRLALEKLGYLELNDYELRSARVNNRVTVDDLKTHDILIVASLQFDLSGLDTEMLATWITGRVLITGHDADVHTSVQPPNNELSAQGTFLKKAISYVR